MTVQFPEHRDRLGLWLNDYGFLGEGAEIGCAFGGFAELVVRDWKGQKLYMVDPWEKQDDYRECTNETAPFEEWYLKCCHLTHSRIGNPPEIQLIRKRSTDGARDIKDGQLDWVFIDGNHRYENVCEDLRAWWTKVRSGGVFSGHDFVNHTMEERAGYDCEVQKAVEEFVEEMRLPKPVISSCSSFWFIKP